MADGAGFEPAAIRFEGSPAARSGRIAPAPLALAALAAALAFGVVLGGHATEGGQPAAGRASPPVALASGTPPISVATVAMVDRSAEAVDLVIGLVRTVNIGDSKAVIGRLAPRVPEPGPAGDVAWPLIPTGMSWWAARSPGAELDEGEVRDFVRYFRTIPGGMLVTGCAAYTQSPVAVTVMCAYSAFGGIQGVAGVSSEAERGLLLATVQDGYVVGVRRTAERNDVAWEELVAWAVATGRSPAPSAGWPDPVYSGATALEHMELAAEFARSGGVPAGDAGRPPPVGGRP